MTGLWVIGAALVVGALIDLYRRRKSSGSKEPRKLSRRDILLAFIILAAMVIVGFAWSRIFPPPPRSDNRPITIVK